jgi:hypothetical protein
MADEEGCGLAFVLFIGAVILCLYFLLIKWMFTTIVPYLSIALILIGPMVVLVLYAKSVVMVFGMPIGGRTGLGFFEDILQKGWRGIGWLPVFGLLLLLYCDFAYWFFAEIIESDVSILQLSPLTSEAVVDFFGIPSNELGILVSVVLKSALLAPMLILIRSLYTTMEDGKQPAKVQYFYGQALQDLKDAIVGTAEDLQQLWPFMAQGAELYMAAGWIVWVFTWPLALAVVIALLIVSVVAICMLGIMIVLHTVGAGIVWVLSMYFSLMLFLIERAVILVRSGYAKCPYAGCHEKVALPVLICPTCGERHDRLIPGRYGVFQRMCTCEKTKLPTLFWFGKGKLDRICPHCNKPLNAELFGGNVHIPIYGGPSTGKTMFMMATTWQMMENQLPEVKTNLIDESDAQNYRDTWKPDFEGGVLREKTFELLPDAFLLSLQRKAGLPVSVYLYDPAGEALVDEQELSGHHFLRYFDGLALLLDPLSLPSMAEAYQESTGTNPPPTTSVADPEEVIHHIVNVLEQQTRLSRKRRFKRRIAIVLSKMDIPLVQQELGVRLSDTIPRGKWQAIGTEDSERIRLWLARHEPALLQLIETRFNDIRFFAQSALGRETEERKTFQPKQVLHPICWLLSKRQMLARPLAAHLGVRAAEVLAVVGTFLLFVGVPLAIILILKAVI